MDSAPPPPPPSGWFDFLRYLTFFHHGIENRKFVSFQTWIFGLPVRRSDHWAMKPRLELRASFSSFSDLSVLSSLQSDPDVRAHEHEVTNENSLDLNPASFHWSLRIHRPCSQLTHVTKKFRANGLCRAKDLARTSILWSFRIEKQELASLWRLSFRLKLR